MKHTFSLFIICLLSCLSNFALAGAGKATSGRIMWSAFVCTMYAEMSKNHEQQQRLFDLGVDRGREFLRAVRAGEIADSEISNKVPLAVAMSLNGPTIDFIIGRIFEQATGYAFDSVVKMDSNGLTLEVSSWVTDEKTQKLIAEDKYITQNCEFVR